MHNELKLIADLVDKNEVLEPVGRSRTILAR
jgi:hypothetical protein